MIGERKLRAAVEQIFSTDPAKNVYRVKKQKKYRVLFVWDEKKHRETFVFESVIKKDGQEYFGFSKGDDIFVWLRREQILEITDSKIGCWDEIINDIMALTGSSINERRAVVIKLKKIIKDK